MWQKMEWQDENRLLSKGNFWLADFSWFTEPAEQTTGAMVTLQIAVNHHVNWMITFSRINLFFPYFGSYICVEPRWNALEQAVWTERRAGLGAIPPHHNRHDDISKSTKVQSRLLEGKDGRADNTSSFSWRHVMTVHYFTVHEGTVALPIQIWLSFL